MEIPVEEYLSSPHARTDVLSAIQRCERDETEDYNAFPVMVVKPGTTGFASAWFTVSMDGTYVPGGGKVHAYFRPEGPRFVVSDLGDGLRAYRMRTGVRHDLRSVYYDLPKDKRVQNVLSDNGTDALIAWHPRDEKRDRFDLIDADDLPDAICRVLLASWMVANHE